MGNGYTEIIKIIIKHSILFLFSYPYTYSGLIETKLWCKYSAFGQLNLKLTFHNTWRYDIKIIISFRFNL